MEEVEKEDKMTGRSAKSRGGRPRKTEARRLLLTLKCSASERRQILQRAAAAALTTSEYLREMALCGRIEVRSKALPPEALELGRYLAGIAGSLNQIAKRANSGVLGSMEKADLKTQGLELKQLVRTIKDWLQ